jgi:DNA-binding response OmpR family regulator
LLHAFLRKAGFEVTGVSSADAAMKELQSRPEQSAGFDLMLTDIQMPERDGYELTRAVRAAGFTMPIMAVTAHLKDNVETTFLAAGGDGVLSKPINREDLIARCMESIQKDGSGRPRHRRPTRTLIQESSDAA